MPYDPTVAIEFRPIFQKDIWHIKLRDEKVALAVNQCMAESDQELEKIGQSYVERFSDIVGEYYPSRL